ncbi:MAG: CPBP family intramembrane metalloprotease [Prevotella sp.]|nr:CPBP family intramembrane metalloprotease [Staphylococcus sp.]MCM1350120.1 CPBP family intramembrane metalloprotease [Prevotella sp.]
MFENNDSVEGSNKIVFPVSANSKYSIGIFMTTIVLIIGITFLMWAIRLVDTYIARLCLTMIVIVAYTMVAIVAMILTGQFNQLLPSKEKLGLQILIGVGIAAALCLVFGIIPILCGTSLIGSHSDIPMDRMVLIAIQDILFVGAGEEIVFRGYIQNQFTIWLKHKWLAPLFAAILFGFWHLINGNIIQVLFATMIGCIFGYSKYCIKNCSLLSVIIAHGLYDFSLVLLTCFML